MTVTKKHKQRRPWWRITLKYFSLLLMACLLYVTGIVVGVLCLLTPERLTPIVEHVATTSLQNCNVEIGRVEIGLRKTAPFLSHNLFTLEVDSVVITSNVTKALPTQKRAFIPAYADTIAAIDRFSGGINIAELMKGTLDFSDLTIDGLTANIVTIDSKTTNYDIFPPSPEKEDKEQFDIKTLPTVRARNISLVNPKPIRYYDAITATELQLDFAQVMLDANKAPLYKLRFNGNIDSPSFLEYFDIRNLTFGLNGDIEWSQSNPYAIAVKDFKFGLTPVSGLLSARADFSDGLRVDSLDLRINPLEINKIIKLLPPDVGTPKDIKTDAVVTARVSLLEPFIASESVLPHFTADVEIPRAAFTWQDLVLDELATKIRITVASDAFKDVRVDISNLSLKGRATDLKISGYATNLTNDPYFSGTVTGNCNFYRLPRSVRNLIPGTLKGTMHANATVKGYASMLNATDFQKLQADGSITFRDLYWVAPDTISMFWANKTAVGFGTQRAVTTSENAKKRVMSATLTIDTATIFHNVLDMHLKDFSIGLGALNKGHQVAKGEIVPIGGKVKLGEFRLLSLTDSAMVRVRNAQGMASVRIHNGDIRKPEFGAKLMVGRLVTGDRSNRLTIRDAETSFLTWAEPQSRKAKQVAAIYDSLRRVHPILSQDSLIADALRIHAIKHPKKKRERLVQEADSSEVFEFYTDNGIKRFMAGWHFEGKVSSRRARLITPYLPAKNRMRELDVSFNNDTIDIAGLKYSLGRTDFRMIGKITNLRRALASTTGKQPLRINLQLTSDTIDVNQLAETVFAGQAYAYTADSLKQVLNLGTDNDDDDNMEQTVQAATTDKNAERPLLIPKNIDAELSFKGKNIIYADMLLNNFTGTALAYDGVVNINNLKAASDFGAVNMSALYMGRTPQTLKFGMGLKLDRFNIHRFLRIMPAIDSVMPVLRDFSGIISANIAATTDLTPYMDFNLPTMDAAVSLSGDSLVLLDPDTFKSLSKWLLFKDKNRNIIDHMAVQLLVHDGVMELYPFIFNIDRYRLGVQGYNDFNMNFKYHIAVLKSPIPFKFGINIEGNPDKYKIRLGGAKFGEKTPVNVSLVDSTRINLIREIRNVFKRNIRDGEFARLNTGIRKSANSQVLDNNNDSPVDSALFIQQGLIDAPASTTEGNEKVTKKKKKKKEK